MACSTQTSLLPADTDAAFASTIDVDFDSFEPKDAAYVSQAPLARVPGSRLRTTLLIDEPRRLYNAMSYLTWRTGLCFNMHVTLTASSLGFTDYREFLALMPQWHKEMNRCLFAGESIRKANGAPTIRQHFSRRRLSRVNHPHYWMGVVEYARNHGVHVHALCVVPKYACKTFEEKTLAWWRMKAPGLVQPNGIAFRVRHPVTRRARYERQVELFRYIVKTTCETAIAHESGGHVRKVREILRPYPNECTPVRIEAKQLYGISHRLSEGEQDRAGFYSRLDRGGFDEIYRGWELDEFQRRERNEQSRLLAERLSTSQI